MAKHQVDDEPAELRQARQMHLEELRQKEAEINSLRIELAETNKGVVALYSELDDQAEQLRQASELKSRFLSYMSHEFRTPLGSIRSIVRILLDRMDGPLTPEQEKQLVFVQGSAVELTEMVNDLLDLAKIEAGRITISPAWFDMVDLFAALRGMFRPILTTESVSLIFEEPIGLPRVYTDDKKLSQILRNFISNALKFTSQGEVRVSAKPGPEDTIVFAVADTGIGIAPEHRKTIFEEFVQVDSTIQRRLRGTGLGLSLSKKLAHLLNGTVDVWSEVGVGSVFSVTLPMKFAGAAQVQLKPRHTEGVGIPRIKRWQSTRRSGKSPMIAKPPMTVVVVDDNPATLYSTSRILRSAGFEVVEAATGQQGVELAMRGAQLVVLDVNLPDIDGFEVCKKIRANQATARIPVIHLSATFVKDVDKVHGLEAGADGYLTHPVEPPVLIATVNAFLRTRQAEDEMRKSEAKFRAVFDNAVSGIALVSKDWAFEEVNPAMCQLMGRKREELVEGPKATLMPAAILDKSSEIRQQLAKSGTWRGAFPLERPAREPVHLEWNMSRYSVPDVYLAIVTDVTERFLAEEQRRQLLASERAARADAERANRMKDDFLATLSHELRTPLSAILGWSCAGFGAAGDPISRSEIAGRA